MKPNSKPTSKENSARRPYALFVDAPDGSPIPAQLTARRRLVTYKTERQAQRAIARIGVAKLRRFLSGELDFDDALWVQEYYAQISFHKDDKVSIVRRPCAEQS